VGVILSGTLHDGTAGLWEIKKYGGVAIIQDPAEAKFPEMASSARDSVPIDYCLPVEKIARKIITLAAEQPASPPGFFVVSWEGN